MNVHPAARAYDVVSPEYARGRPGYAVAAVEALIAGLGLEPGAAALDLGAGTGKLTALLDAAGLAVVAVDPSEAMLERLRERTPSARTIVGVAEAVPLPDRSVDLVTAAQAFHWFDAAAALPEMHRVLRPGGGIGLVWNRRDDADPLQALIGELTDPPERATPRGWQLDVCALVDDSGLFGPVTQLEFRHVHETDAEGLVSRLRSSSFVASLPAERQRALESRLQSALAGVGPTVELTYTTVAYLACRLPG